jgi:transposase
MNVIANAEAECWGERTATNPASMKGLNGPTFRAYVEQALAPALAPGDVVVLDNLPAHKVSGIREAIAARGATLMYLPPYSPDLNPIEQLFAKLKALLRKAAARTRDSLWSTIGDALDAFTPDECGNYIRNSGYEPVQRQNPLGQENLWAEWSDWECHFAECRLELLKTWQ